MQRGYLQKTAHVGIQRNLSSAQEDNPDFSGEDMKLVHSTADKYTETHIRNTVPVIAPTCGWERGLHGISAQVLQISVLETKDALSSEESCSNPKWFEKQISHGSVCSAWTRSRVPVCPHLHTCALIMYTCPQMEASVFWCFHIKKHSSCTLFQGTQVIVLKPAPCTHAFYTHSQRDVDLLCRIVLSRRDKYWTASEEPGDDKRPRQ